MNEEDDRAMEKLLATLEPAVPSARLAERIARIPGAHPRRSNVFGFLPRPTQALFAAAALLALGVFVGAALDRVEAASEVSVSEADRDGAQDDWSNSLDEPFEFPDILGEENL
jgi:hypothetical protein